MNIDKMLNNVIGKKKGKKNKMMNFGGIDMFSNIRLGGIKQPMGKTLPNASLKMQKQWRMFSPMKKQQMRILHNDYDKDRVPNRWDCQPMNPMRQDDEVLYKVELVTPTRPGIIPYWEPTETTNNYEEINDILLESGSDVLTHIKKNNYEIVDNAEYIIGIGKNEQEIKNAIKQIYINSLISADASKDEIAMYTQNL